MGLGQSSHETELDRVLPTQVIIDGGSAPMASQDVRAFNPIKSNLSLTKKRFPISLLQCSCDNWRIKLSFKLEETCHVIFTYFGEEKLHLKGIGPGEAVDVFSPSLEAKAVSVVVKVQNTDNTLNINLALLTKTKVSVTTQQASISGQLFEVENMYGLSTEKRCIICMGDEVTVAFQPCRHACMCSDCADNLSSRDLRKCPVCRAHATGLIKLSISNNQKR